MSIYEKKVVLSNFRCGEIEGKRISHVIDFLKKQLRNSN